MRIIGPGGGQAQEPGRVTEGGAPGVDRRKSEPAPGTQDPHAAVVLSEGAIASAAVAKEHATSREARISAIRSAIQAGMYHVDLDKLAERILQDELSRGAGR